VPAGGPPESSEARSILLARPWHSATPTEQASVTAALCAIWMLGPSRSVKPGSLLAEGELADLLITDGDPLAEPQLFDDPSRIWLVL
jgi:hypothetical protein